MAKCTVNQKKKIINRLKEINIITEKDILNLKVSKLKELKEQGKITIADIETIWNIQDVISERDILKIITDTE